MIALLAAATAAIASAPSDKTVIGFAPPLGIDLIYIIDQAEDAPVPAWRRISRRVVRFEREDGALVLHVRPVEGQSTGNAGQSARFRAATAPLNGLDQIFELDANGRITALRNQAEIWAAAIAGQKAVLALSDDDPERQKQVIAVVDMMDSMDAPAQLGLLAGDITPLLRFAHYQPDEDASQPDAPRIAGSEANVLLLDEDRGDSSHSLKASYRVNMQDGLVWQMEKHVRASGYSFVEIRTLATGSEPSD